MRCWKLSRSFPTESIETSYQYFQYCQSERQTILKLPENRLGKQWGDASDLSIPIFRKKGGRKMPWLPLQKMSRGFSPSHIKKSIQLAKAWKALLLFTTLQHCCLSCQFNLERNREDSHKFSFCQNKQADTMHLLTSVLLVPFGSFQGSSQTGTSGHVHGSEGGKLRCTQRPVGTAQSDSTRSLKTEWTLGRSLWDHHPTDSTWNVNRCTGLSWQLRISATMVF